MAYNKTTWENAPSTNTPINANNLNKIEEGIYQNSLKADQVGDLSTLETTIKTNLVNAINEIKDAEIYSTTEVKTNRVWIDNKPIYRKVLTGSTPSSSVTSWTTLTTIPNLDAAINIYGALEGTSKNFVPRYESNSFYFILSAESTDIKYKQVGYNSKNYHIILEYTKTTD